MNDLADFRAKLLLRVGSLQAADRFYISNLGWKPISGVGSVPSHMRILQILPGYNALVVGPGASSIEEQDREIEKRLAPNAHRPAVGDSFYVGVPSIAAVEAEIRQRGIQQLQHEEDPGSIRKLMLRTPGGYTLIYWEELFPSDEEIMDMYARGADELEKAVSDLSPEELDWREARGKWSIREQLLHVVDLELVTVHKVKFALAQPGRSYVGNAFSQDVWSVGLAYSARPVAAELALFRAVRGHITDLCRILPDALQRTVLASGGEESVGKLLKMMCGHAQHHIRAIRRIRELNGHKEGT